MVLLASGSLHSRCDIFAGIWLFCLLFVNVLLAIYVFYMCASELVRKSQGLVNFIDRIASGKLSSLETPPLHCPVSESIELCWTYRDGILVNLPSVLLVPGDIILLRPGHPVACRCHDFKGNMDFERDDVYLPRPAHPSNVTNAPPLEPLTVEVTECQAAAVLRECHMFGVHTISPLEKEYDLILHTCFEKVVLPSVAFVCLISSVSRYFAYQRLDLYWLGTFTVDVGIAVLPLLFPSLPLFFIGFKFYNSARLFHTTESSVLQYPFVRRSTEGAALAEECKAPQRNVLTIAASLFLGKGNTLPFTSSLYPILGSVTSVAMINKKGILSWPDPSVEKAFFLSNDSDHQSKQKFRADTQTTLSSLVKKAYVMDFSQEATQAFKVHFDDPNWRIFLSHLKPLGLNALMNGCLLQTEYCRFLDHLRAMAPSVPGTTAVINRRCLCCFTDAMQLPRNAIDHFQQPPTVLCAYRTRAADSPPVPGAPKYKVPFPNLFATINRDMDSCYVQMMCQGSADMVLDICRYYWDGETVRPLHQSHVKRVQDFSNRHNMTAYCLALSYRPLPLWVADVKPSGYYDLTCHCCRAKEETETENRQPCPVSCSLDSVFFDELLMGADKSERALPNLLFDNHIFLGMVSFQYHAKPDIVHLVEQLDKSCIRFVHFSKENELRSRVFAEKMGLEAGWNCHISLEKDHSPDGVACSDGHFRYRPMYIASRLNTSTLSATRGLNSSLPNIRTLIKEYGRPMPSFGVTSVARQSISKEHSESATLSSSDPELIRLLLPDGQELRSSLSEQSTVSAELSVAPSFANAEKFLLANRARLPKGIENVRPHLENVDNVPLLVSLFTDCNAWTTCEMIEIMQEYGEVVCVVGSSLTPQNTGIFCRANVAISVEPMVPSGCCEMQQGLQGQNGRSALEIAHFINSLPCSWSTSLGEQFSLNSTINLSRTMLLAFRISFYFFLSISMLVTVVHVVALLFAMPRPLSANMVLWLLCGVLPPLCATVALSPLRSVGPELVTFKDKLRLGRREVQLACRTFATKFAPTAFALFLLHKALIHYLCKFEAAGADARWPTVNGTSKLYLYWNANSDQLYVVQRLCSSFLVLYIVALSASQVFPFEHIWKRAPYRSMAWTSVGAIVLLAQLAFYVLPICISSRHLRLMMAIPWYVYFAGCLWPLVAICVNELAKRFEISRFNRDQRRRRLSFDTKLGMNSPF
uniref:Cation-transporting P-type ATPase C-terminal domain-containing protein n=1 Tax=Trichuris muris TaxID=70415 RepID=A0A5S6QK89_TRIMR